MLLPVMYAAHHGDSTQLLVCMYAYTATGKGTQLRRRGGAAAHAARYARYIRSTSWRLRVCRIWRSTAGHKMCQSMYRTCQLLYMICKMRVYICACIDACVCTDACASVCVYVCICVLKCLRAECRRLYVGISLSHRNEARFVIFGRHVLQGLQIFLPWERCFRNQAFAFLSGCPSRTRLEPPQKCRSQKVGIIKCKSRADRSKPVGLLVRPPAACSAMAARRFGPA